MKVFVTGGSGFIGRPIVAELVRAGHDVVSVSRNPSPVPKNPDQAHPDRTHGVNHQVLDLLDAGATRALVERIKPDTIVHLGWRNVVGDVLSSKENLRWVQATQQLIEAFGESGGKRFIGCGTCFEYESSPVKYTEAKTSIKPATVYGHSKAAVAHLVQAAAQSFGFSWVWPRIFYAYGPNEDRSRFVGSVVASLVNGDEAPMTHGQQVRDYLHTSDIASAIVSMVASEASGQFNVCSGHAVTLASIATEIGRQTGNMHLLKIGAIEARMNENDIVVGDNSLATATFNWKPKVSLSDGIADVIDQARAANNSTPTT